MVHPLPHPHAPPPPCTPDELVVHESKVFDCKGCSVQELLLRRQLHRGPLPSLSGLAR